MSMTADQTERNESEVSRIVIVSFRRSNKWAGRNRAIHRVTYHTEKEVFE